MAKKRSVRRCIHVPTPPSLSNCPLGEGEVPIPPERPPAKALIGLVTLDEVSKSMPQQVVNGAISRVLSSGRWPSAKWREVWAEYHLLKFNTLGGIKKLEVLERLGFKRGICIPEEHLHDIHRSRCTCCKKISRN